MKARAAALLLFLAVFAAGLGWLAHRTFSWERAEVWSGYQGEALGNDFLAAQRLLQRTGHPAACVPALPSPLPPPGDVLILPRRRLPMAAGEAARIAAWVAQGGLLVAEGTGAGPGPRDALFELFGAREVAEQGPAPGPVSFSLDGMDLRVELGGHAGIQAPGALAAGRTAPDRDPELVELGFGRGRALLCTSLRGLGNDGIQRLDHADFLCALASLRPGGRVWIVSLDPPATAWGWLLRNAWPVLAALAALGLGAVWSAAPRFGPPLPDPDPARRDFLEHLDACGRYQWQVDRGRTLLAAAREACRQRLARAHPGWAQLDPEQLSQRLASQSGLSRERILRALDGPAPGPPAAFLEAIQTLHLLGRQP